MTVLEPIFKKFKKTINECIDVDGKPLVFSTNHSIDYQNQVLHEQRKVIDGVKNELIQIDETKFRFFSPQELSVFLQSNGFQIEGFYGDFDLNQTFSEQFRMIAVASRKD